LEIQIAHTEVMIIEQVRIQSILAIFLFSKKKLAIFLPSKSSMFLIITDK
jgi:hypothetical protein